MVRDQRADHLDEQRWRWAVMGEAVLRSKAKPRRHTPTTGCFGQGGLRLVQRWRGWCACSPRSWRPDPSTGSV